MKPMKLDIQMFATPLPVRLNINFKNITEDELPESLTFSFDGEQAIIQITGISEEYFWTSSNGGNTFDSITIETEGYSITVLQVGDGTGTIYIDVYKNIVPITNFNGAELTNIYYNGTEISKMYCNGVLVFEKGPTVYKRRIMVGDVFDSNSKIFSDIPDNFINEELPNMGVVDPKQDIITGNIFNVGELYIAGFYRVYIDYKNIPDDGSGYDEQFYVYDVYSYGTMLNNKEVPLDKLNTNDIIVSVNDNITYRHLYIEDPNIRPLQVGDKLVNKTKLYFVFPDDCYEKIKSSEYIVKINTITNEELGIITYWSASSQEINIGKITYDPNKVVNNGTTIYVWVDMLGQLYKNTSFNLVEDLSLDGLQFIGAVSEINSNSEIYNYILVDTTTLG